MKQDRFLMVIIIAIGLLAGAALLLFFVRRGEQSYGAEDTPQGVVRNYVLAVNQKDYERAYSYLQEAKDKPTLHSFKLPFLNNQLEASNSWVQIGEVQVSEQEAWVELWISRGGSGIFADVYRERGQAYLERNQAGEWKLVNMPYPFWNWDWYTPAPQSSQLESLNPVD